MTPPPFLRNCLPWLLFTLALVAPLAAQDTRGSLVPDTPILLADGSTRAVQDVTQGTVLWTWLPGTQPLLAKVSAVRRQHADSYILLKAGGKEVQATGSHRVALANGELVRLDKVKVGDKVLLWAAKGPEEAVVTSVRLYPANLVAYDLTIEGHRLFQAGGILLAD